MTREVTVAPITDMTSSAFMRVVSCSVHGDVVGYKVDQARCNVAGVPDGGWRYLIYMIGPSINSCIWLLLHLT